MGEPAKKSSPLRTVIDPAYGFRVLADRPAQEDVERYFEDAYYADIDKGDKAADIKRARDGGEEADRQKRWMAHTLYADVAETLRAHAPGKTVLEVGCGLGDLLAYLRDAGFEASGADIAPDAAQAARARGFDVHLGAFERLARDTLKDKAFDAVLFMNVLEQMHDPKGVIEAARDVLAPGGVVLVRSGNDFNPLQQALCESSGCGEYWVVEDHLSYFNFETLARLFDDLGFDVAYQQSDFPMELMALLGFDYVRDPRFGPEAHERRVAFEETAPPELRRRLYRAFAQAGLGRCLFMAANKRGR